VRNEITNMKNNFYILLFVFPTFLFSQEATFDFKLDIENDSSINFNSTNNRLNSYLLETIDNEIERGYFPKEKSYVNIWLGNDGKLDSISVYGSFHKFNHEIKLALENINTIRISNLEYTPNLRLIVIFDRWKEGGEFSINGGIASGE
jgi:hypothetical protein